MSNRRGINGNGVALDLLARRAGPSTSSFSQIRTFKYQAPPTPLPRITPIPPRHKRPTLSPTVSESELPSAYFPHEPLPSVAKGLRRRKEREAQAKWAEVIKVIEGAKADEDLPDTIPGISSSAIELEPELDVVQEVEMKNRVYDHVDAAEITEENTEEVGLKDGPQHQAERFASKRPKDVKYFVPPHTHQHAFLQHLFYPLNVPHSYIPKILDHKSLTRVVHRMDPMQMTEYIRQRRSHAKTRFEDSVEKRAFYSSIGREGDNNAQLAWIGDQTMRFHLTSLISDLHKDYLTQGEGFWRGFTETLKKQGHKWESPTTIHPKQQQKLNDQPKEEYSYELPVGMRVTQRLLDYMLEPQRIGESVGGRKGWTLVENDVIGWIQTKENGRWAGERKVCGTAIQAILGAVTHLYGLKTSSKFFNSRIAPLLDIPLHLALCNSFYTAWGRENRLLASESMDSLEKRDQIKEFAKLIPEHLAKFEADVWGNLCRESILFKDQARPDLDTRLDKNIFFFAEAFINKKKNEDANLNKDLTAEEVDFNQTSHVDDVLNEIAREQFGPEKGREDRKTT